MRDFLIIIFSIGIFVLPIFFYKIHGTNKMSGHRLSYAAFMTTIVLLVIATIFHIYLK